MQVLSGMAIATKNIQLFSSLLTASISKGSFGCCLKWPRSPILTFDPRKTASVLSSRPLSVWRCSVVWPLATMVEAVVWGGAVTWCLAHRPLYLQLLTGGHCVLLFFAPALTSQPWLTWFVVAPRSEGGSWIMSSYSLRGGPRLVDYRIDLTDQREVWLLSNSPHKER